MDASEFEGLLYNMLSEEPFANNRLDITDENDDYKTSDYVSQHFGIKIGDTMTCLTCHATNHPKIFHVFSFILPLEEISHIGKRMIPISHEKMTHLGKSCVTMTDLMEFFIKTELSDVICEECTLSIGTTRKSNFEKNNQY